MRSLDFFPEGGKEILKGFKPFFIWQDFDRYSPFLAVYSAFLKLHCVSDLLKKQCSEAFMTGILLSLCVLSCSPVRDSVLFCRCSEYIVFH